MTAQRSRRYEVRISPTAADDLRGIRTWIAQRSPDAAEIVIRRLHAAAESLRTMPRRGRWAPEGDVDDAPTRQLVAAGYRMVYTIHEQTVKVHFFMHHARRPRE
jgi:plasmid stabilization system protein ParE